MFRKLESSGKTGSLVYEWNKSRNIYFFGPFRPGHGAPTYDIRKKKFTEHQLDVQVRQNLPLSTNLILH